MIPNLLDLITVALLSSTISGIIVYSYLFGLTKKTFRILGKTEALLDLIYERHGNENDIAEMVESIRELTKSILWRKADE